MSTTEPLSIEVFPDADTHVTRVANPQHGSVFFLITPTAGARGIVAFRGKQQEHDYAFLPRLPHAVTVDGATELLCLSFEGDVEVIRAVEGTVNVTASNGADATEKCCEEFGKLLGLDIQG